MLQPIDAGIGYTLKRIMGFVQDEWLQKEDNLRSWEGDSDAIVKLNASMRRILITQWAGEAWERLTNDQHYQDSFYDCFARTGAGLTADRSDDDLVIPCKGLKNYVIPTNIADEYNAVEYHDNVTIIEPSNENEDSDDIIIEEDDTNDVVGEAEEEYDFVISQDTSSQSVVFPMVDEVQDGSEGSEDHTDKNESWNESVEKAASMKIAWEISEVPCIINVNTYALIFHDEQWDLVKILKQINDNTYRYKLESSYEWGERQFDSADHGRNNISSSRWVSLKKKHMGSKK